MGITKPTFSLQYAFLSQPFLNWKFLFGNWWFFDGVFAGGILSFLKLGPKILLFVEVHSFLRFWRIAFLCFDERVGF